MAVFTFSAKPKDEQAIKLIKRYCEIHCINFSALVVEQLKQYKEEVIDVKDK